MSAFATRAAKAVQSFEFKCVVVEDDGRFGHFTKKVDAASTAAAWQQVTKELKASSLLQHIKSMELQ